MGDKKQEKKERTLAEKLKFYTTFTAASLAICTFSLFLFLIPFVIDPTVATINQDFIEDPVDCKVVLNKYILGASRCSWSSCREGCTRDLYECNHVYVEYQLRPEDVNSVVTSTDHATEGPAPSSNSSMVAALMVNIRACGYPPAIVCDNWYNESAVNDSTIPCYYSRTNTSLAITDRDPEQDMVNLYLCVLLPLITCAVSVAILLCLHCTPCCPATKEKSTEERSGSKRSVTSLPQELEMNIVKAVEKNKYQKQEALRRSANIIKRKVDVFDLPRIAKKLKTFHFDQGVDEVSLSLDNIISISTSTSSNSASSNSFGSKEPPSPDIF